MRCNTVASRWYGVSLHCIDIAERRRPFLMYYMLTEAWTELLQDKGAHIIEPGVLRVVICILKLVQSEYIYTSLTISPSTHTTARSQYVCEDPRPVSQFHHRCPVRGGCTSSKCFTSSPSCPQHYCPFAGCFDRIVTGRGRRNIAATV